MRYFEDAKTIWQTQVPKRGQADTVAGELLRSVEKLRDEATRNGNVNWGLEVPIGALSSPLRLLRRCRGHASPMPSMPAEPRVEP